MDTATLYVLTDLGRSLNEPLGALGRWVDANWDLVDAAQQAARLGSPNQGLTGAIVDLVPAE